MPVESVDLTLRIAVAQGDGQAPAPQRMEFVRSLFAEDDELAPASADELVADSGFDATVCLGICGSTPLAETLARQKLPCMAVEPHLGFHPYHAAFYRAVERGHGVVLPATTPGEIADSIQALRACRQLRGAKLIVVNGHEDGFRADEVQAFARGCRERLGVEVLRHSVAEMEERAAGHDDADADETPAQWYRDVLEGTGEMDDAHMRQVAKLYLAEREMLDEAGAVGITVDNIGGFLLTEPRKIMPNVTYGPLVFEGFLAAEEGDVEVLTTELLLSRGLGAHPTMSNIYLAYRDRFGALADHSEYTTAMEQDDFLQCLADDRVTAAHFSTSGVLPPAMMEEERYRIRETLPAWPGQSMIASTPKLGPVVMARIAPDASGLHFVPGQVDERGFGDHYGWYRGRWFIKIPSVSDFIARCQHQHYAIGPENGRRRVLEIMTEKLLGLEMA